MMSATVIFLWLCGALTATSVLGVIASGRPVAATRFVYGATGAISALGLVLAVRSLLEATSSSVVLPLGLPWIGAHFRVDALSSFFLLIVNLGGVGASLFGLGNGRHEHEPHRVLPFFAAFLAAMNLVVLADDAFTFLLSWEAMSLTSWALVMAHHRDEGNARAGYVYLVMASLGTLVLLLAFGLLAGPAGAYDFSEIRQLPHGAALTGLAFVLVLIGAGSKAGLVPMHAWLPLAHPAAPSHVSALMSGVMTKVAIYAFIRVAFDLLGAPVWWSGLVVIIVGSLSAVLGILSALMETDLKRILANSTIENVGVIFVGLGLALAFRSDAMPTAAALAMSAALFHVFNHSLFKSLLFFGAGSVLTATGERDIGRLGGLIHRMPVTAAAVLVGCVSISALPPFNGFVSEWLTFQAILQSPAVSQWGLKIIVPAGGGLLALSAGLAAACFVRLYGIGFLGRPRSVAAGEAVEVEGGSLAAMLLLAFLCFMAGVVPGVVIDGLAPVAKALTGAAMPVQGTLPWLSLMPLGIGKSSYNGLLVFVFIVVTASFAAFLVHRFASRETRRAPAWDCGFPEPSLATQYSASGFSQPLRRVFGTLLFRARDHVDMPPPGDARPARLDIETHDLVWDYLYRPVVLAIGASATWLNRFQFMTIRKYIGFVFGALVFLLLVLALWT